MFKVFDYRCVDCGHQEERFVRIEEMDDQRHAPCEVDPTVEPEAAEWCGRMVRLPAGTRTHFKFADEKLK